MNRLLRLGLASTLALAACHGDVQGDGQLATEARTVAPFDEVEVSLGIEAALTANAADQSLSLSGDSNLLQYVLTPVEAGVLKTRLHGTEGIDPIFPLRLTAQSLALHRVQATERAIADVRGAGSAEPGFTFQVEASGASSVSLAGRGGERLVVKLESSALDAGSYPVSAANVLLTGGALLKVHCTSDVAGSAAQGSIVQVTGGGGCGALILSGGATCKPSP